MLDSTAVLCCFDEGYAPAACVMLTSLFENNAHVPFDVHAIVDEVSAARRGAIEALCRAHGRCIRWLEVEKERYGFFGISDHFTRAAYLRIFGPELIDARRILYLDVDLIVQTEIRPLLDLDMGDHVLAAALDVSPSPDARARLRLLPRDPYVNTGVLVIDGERWRKEGVTEALVAHYAEQGERLFYADQDLINEGLAGRIGLLKGRWNRLYGDVITGRVDCSDFDAASFRGIFHYNTGAKPWTWRGREPYASLYRSYARRSPIRMSELPKPGPIEDFRRRLPRALEWKPWKRRSRRFLHALRSKGHDLVRRLLGPRHGRPTGSYGHPKPSFSLHMVCRHEDVPMALWCLKSFSCFARLSPAVFIHDDGSLSEDDVASFHEQVAHATVIRRAEADLRVDAWLQGHPRCRAMRKEQAGPRALKLFDPWCHAPHDVLLLVDSDVLFFRRPGELLEHATEGRPCFNSDHQDAYAASVDRLKERLGVEVLPEVNAGLMVLTREHYDLDLAERYFEAFPTPVFDLHEQTIYAILLSLAGATRLSPAHQISRQPIGAETVSHHFVRDGSREQFWTKGARILLQRRVFGPRCS